MTRVHIDDVLSDLIEDAAETAIWQEAWPSRSAAMAARRDQTRLAILAEFDRLHAIAYGPREVEAMAGPAPRLDLDGRADDGRGE